MDIQEEIKKLLFQELKNLPDNEYLLFPNLQIAIQTKLHINDFDNIAKEFEEVINQLIDKKYIVYDNFRIPRFAKGINFDKWEEKMNTNKNNINIQNLHTTNAQIGNNNNFYNGCKPEDFITFLEIFEKEKNKKKFIEKIKSMISSGADIMTIISSFLNIK
jgi:hypothetical protein